MSGHEIFKVTQLERWSGAARFSLFLHATQHVEFLMRIFGKYFFIRMLKNILKHTFERGSSRQQASNGMARTASRKLFEAKAEGVFMGARTGVKGFGLLKPFRGAAPEQTSHECRASQGR